jgi:16S rRNA (uracil1498-N3)-methyltransferase
MRKLRAYTPQSLIVGEEIELAPETAHHLINVLRLGAGDEIVLFNGQGGEYTSQLSFAKKGKGRATILAFNDVNRESPLSIHLYQGISRGDRMDFALQKATELGVTAITPLLCEHSQFKGNEKQQEKKQQHWQQIIISAAQQSWRCKLPKLNPPCQLDAALGEDTNTSKLFFHTQSESQLGDILSEQTSLSIYIGPEGGFSDNEHTLAKNAGAIDVLLGPRILRTETATVAAITLAQYLAGDF